MATRDREILPHRIDVPVDMDMSSAEAAGPNFGDVLVHAIGRYWFSILFLTGLGILGGLFAGVVQPNQYMSVGKVLVRLGFREQATPESAVDASFETRGGGVGLGDEVELLMNPALYARVAARVGPSAVLEPYDPAAKDGPTTPRHHRWLHEVQSWWALRKRPAFANVDADDDPGLLAAAAITIGERASIDANRRNNTIHVTYQATSPKLAQRVVQAYLDVIKERHREVFLGAHELEFVKEQMRVAIEQAEAARARFAERRLETGIFDVEARREILVARMQGLQTQLDQDGTRLASIAAEESFIAEQMTALEPTLNGGAATTTSIENPRYGSLIAQLVARNEERLQLQQDFVPDSQVYKNAEASLQRRIDDLEEQLDETPPFLTTDEAPAAVVLNPARDLLRSRRWALEQEKGGILEGQKLRENALADCEAKLQELVPLEPEYAEFARRVAEAEDRRAQRTAALTRAETLAMIERNEHMSNLMVVQDATLPNEKVSPDRVKILGMGTAAGFFLGLALAVLRILLDPKLRYPETVETTLGVRVLGTIPDERKRWRKRMQATA